MATEEARALAQKDFAKAVAKDGGTLIKGDWIAGTAHFTDPAKAWNVKMAFEIDSYKVTMREKTRIQLGMRCLCEPRIIVVRWKI